MNNYNYWKSFSKVKIVYSAFDFIMFNDKSYPKGYVVDASNKQQLETAIGWASCYDHNDPVVIETDNLNFELQIASAANCSSQGGKLSFWMCIVNKPGIAPCAVGINSELLLSLLLGSTFKNGKCENKVMFARKSSQLGVLHEDMKEYAQLKKDEEAKKKINAHKTTKWKVGFEYKTLTASDTMLGMFDPIIDLNRNTHVVYNRFDNLYTYTIDFDVTPKPKYVNTYDYTKNKKHTLEELIAEGFNAYNFKFNAKCPSRQEGDQVFDKSDITEDVIEYLYRSIDKMDSIYELSTFPVHAFSVCSKNPKVTLDLMEKVLAKIKEDLASIKDDLWPTNFTSSFYGDNIGKKPIKQFIDQSVAKKFLADVVCQNETVRVDSFEKLYEYLIELLRNVTKM